MSTVMAKVAGLPRDRALTRADLESMPDDGHRYELVDGTLVVTPAPRIAHQTLAANLFVALRTAAPGDMKVFFAPLDVVLADDTVLQPDLLVAPRAAFTDRDLPGPPLLAVEVLSPSTRGVDLLLKKDRLERAGSRHYWVVDPEQPSITAWALTGGKYSQVAHAEGPAVFEVTDPLRSGVFRRRWPIEPDQSHAPRVIDTDMAAPGGAVQAAGSMCWQTRLAMMPSWSRSQRSRLNVARSPAGSHPVAPATGTSASPCKPAATASVGTSPDTVTAPRWLVPGLSNERAVAVTGRAALHT